MLLKGVDRMVTHAGVSYNDLEKHMNDNPSYEHGRHPTHRPAWDGDPWPYVTIQSRRALRRMDYEAEFADSLVHCEWQKRSDYVSPDREQRALQGLPEFDFDPTPLYK
eukprot:3807002-Pyramimonas_sp.AAC.1